MAEAGCIAAVVFGLGAQGCGGDSRSERTKVTSALVSEGPNTCVVQGEIDGGDGCFPDTRFHFFLSDGSETETGVLFQGTFRAAICRDPSLFTTVNWSTSCGDGLSVPCSEIVRYETTTDDRCLPKPGVP